MKKFDVVMMPIEEIKPYYRNAKVHNRAQVGDIARSIRDFGFDQPVVVDKDQVIIEGHGRYLAALRLKLQNVPVVVREDLSEAQVIASRVADNKVFEMTAIDTKKHEQELTEIAEALTEEQTSDLDFAKSPDAMEEGGVTVTGQDEGGFDTSAPWDESDNSMPPEPELEEDGTLLTCPKCIHSFYVAEE